jgi:hypothetical protein
MAIQDGTYAARPGQARVYENDKGSLVACIEMHIDGGPVLKSFHTLAKADGTLMTRTIDNLKAWSGWDGTDPFWLTDNDLTGIPVEVVVENQPGMSDPTKMYASVKWVNPPGGGGSGMAENGDRRAILAKYGAKLRANAGGVAVGAGAPPRVRNSECGTRNGGVSTAKGTREMGNVPRGGAEAQRGGVAMPPPAGPVPRPPAAATPAKTSDMNTCWGLMCDLRQKMPKAQVEQEWFAAVGIVEGKDQADMTPEEWGRVEEFILAKYGSGAVPRPAPQARSAECGVRSGEGAGEQGAAGEPVEDNIPF